MIPWTTDSIDTGPMSQCTDTDESFPTINPVRVACGFLNTPGNPFARLSGKSLAASLALSEQDTDSSPSVATPHKEEFKFAVPAVAFPYATETTAQLAEDFNLIETNIGALPCEVERNQATLPARRNSGRKALVLGVEGLLVSRSGEHGAGLRPGAKEFVRTVGERFEILVSFWPYDVS